MSSTEWSATGRHPSTNHLINLFSSVEHLTSPMREISINAGALAALMVNELGDGPELTAGLRKLLEAKDCFVRQCVLDQKEKEAAELINLLTQKEEESKKKDA